MNYFSFNDYTSDKGCFCMHCGTIEEAEAFAKVLDNAGRTWRNNGNYTTNLHYEDYGEDTCYYFNEGTYGSYNYASKNGEIILEYSDFCWGEEPEICESEENAQALDSFFVQFQILKEN